MTNRVVFIGSTGGAVLSRLLQHQFVKEMTDEVVSDRECGFIEVGERFGVESFRLNANSGEDFSNALCDRYWGRENLVFLSFYTKLFKGRFLKINGGALFNCHPSLLPSFKGTKGFEDTLGSSALFMGCTLHRVDEGMDTGQSVIQVALPIDRSLPASVNRHKIFLSQLYSTLQFLKWIHEQRLRISAEGDVSVENIAFSPSPFSPNLDRDFFRFTGIQNELL